MKQVCVGGFYKGTHDEDGTILSIVIRVDSIDEDLDEVTFTIVDNLSPPGVSISQVGDVYVRKIGVVNGWLNGSLLPQETWEECQHSPVKTIQDPTFGLL